ncbi:MAG: outer membrane beta-barrel protein, partial [Bacteroidales bacterium]|nr:outer membrane beta-barrel protein [Bacteroidales bacterium]
MQKNKILVIIGVLMLLGSSVLAQKFSGGVKAALVISQVDGDNLSGYNKVGAMAGAFANFTFLNERLKLQLDLDYIQKGSRQPQTGDVPDSYKMSVQQVEVPVLLGVRLFSGFWLEVGPSFDITFKGKEYLNGIEAAGSATFKVFELEALAGVN